MNDPALVAAARRLLTAHIAYGAAARSLHDAAEAYRLAERELNEAVCDHRILLTSTEDADLIEAPQ